MDRMGAMGGGGGNLLKGKPFQVGGLRVRFFGRIRKRICDPRSYGFFDAKETQNPKKDYFVMTRQAGGTQYIYYNDISLVLP